MQIDKDMILNFLRDRGEHDKAQAADRELPAKVDTDDSGQRSILDRLGIDLSALSGLLDKLPGGLGDKLGGLGKMFDK
jgi:hypothetical protein